MRGGGEIPLPYVLEKQKYNLTDEILRRLKVHKDFDELYDEIQKTDTNNQIVVEFLEDGISLVDEDGSQSVKKAKLKDVESKPMPGDVKKKTGQEDLSSSKDDEKKPEKTAVDTEYIVQGDGQFTIHVMKPADRDKELAKRVKEAKHQIKMERKLELEDQSKKDKTDKAESKKDSKKESKETNKKDEANAGRVVINGLSQMGSATLLVWQTIKQLKMINLWHVFQQMAHLGVDSLPIISLTLLFAGAVMTLQITDVLITYGAQSTVGGLMAVAMGRELGPILVGVVLAGRVGAAITAEIGTTKVTEQIDALRVMAVDPVGYLVVPRVVACMIMVPILAFYGVVIGIAGGYFVATVIKGLAPSTYLDSIQMFSTISDFTLGLIKSSVFGAVIALVGAYKGMETKMGAEAVGFSTTSSVVTSIILVFVLNYFLSTLLF